jgi:amidase
MTSRNQMFQKKAVDFLKTLKKGDNCFYARYIRAVTATYQYWNTLDQERAIIRHIWENYFQKYDVLLCPVTRIAAFHHDHTSLVKRKVKCNGRIQPFMDFLRNSV